MSYSYWQEYLGRMFGLLGYFIQSLALRVGDVKVCYTERVYGKLKNISKRSRIYKLPGICIENNPNFPVNFREKNNIIFLSRFVKEKNPLLAIDTAVEYKKLGWDVYATKDLDNGEEAYELEERILEWIRIDMGLPRYLLSEQMPQGGHTETVDASEIDLPTIWAKVEELSKKI